MASPGAVAEQAFADHRVGKVAEDGDDVARVGGQEPGHGVAVLFVVEGDALDDAFQRIERRAVGGSVLERIGGFERTHRPTSIPGQGVQSSENASSIRRAVYFKPSFRISARRFSSVTGGFLRAASRSWTASRNCSGEFGTGRSKTDQDAAPRSHRGRAFAVENPRGYR